MNISIIWNQFKKSKCACIALLILMVLFLIGVYAPLFASNKPLLVIWKGTFYFPLLRYLLYSGFYTKPIDLFFNLLMLTLPFFLIGSLLLKGVSRKIFVLGLFATQMVLFGWVISGAVKDPAHHPSTQYDTLNQLLTYKQIQAQYLSLAPITSLYLEKTGREMPLLWQVWQRNQEAHHQRLLNAQDTEALKAFDAQREWLSAESEQIRILIPPLFRFFHWEEDAGGSQEANQYLPWWELTRINRKDLAASLLFGIRVSIVVGVSAVVLALLIGIPLGMFAGYFAGATDLVICRIIEMWEAMPTFFMLLLVVAITQSKSIFLVIGVLGIFGWTSIGRFIRSEVLKQRKLPYVLACHSMGFTHTRVMFSHILPNAIPPILTLLPFSVMAAITSEAGLSFLGLGEEGSASWGVLMDEGRTVFPAETYLLWPPALLLTVMLICIALVGDALRDAIDPKMRR